MPVDTVSFWLKPFGFFDRNPTLDVAAAAGALRALMLLALALGLALTPPCFGAASRDPETPASTTRCARPSRRRWPGADAAQQPVPVDRRPGRRRSAGSGAAAARRRSRWSVTATRGTGGRRSSTSRRRRAGAALDHPHELPAAEGAARPARAAADAVPALEGRRLRLVRRAIPRSRTLFVAGLSGGSGVVPRRGTSRFEASVRGYLDAWAALPGRRIVVAARHAQVPRLHRRLRDARAAARTPAGDDVLAAALVLAGARSGGRRRRAGGARGARPVAVLLRRSAATR